MIEPTKKPQVIIFDVDKTLTGRISWYEFTRQIGASPQKHAEIYTSFMDGKIDYSTMKTQLMKIWAGSKKYSKKDITDIFDNIAIDGEVHATIHDLQDRGYEICLISSSIIYFVESVAKKLNIKHFYANSNFIFEDDVWVDVAYTKDEGMLKAQQLKTFLEENNYTPQDCVAIGDGDNDREIFKMVPGIAMSYASDHLKQLAWKEIKYIPRLLQLLESI